MFLERVRQPFAELNFFSVFRSNQIRLPGQQTLARRKTNEIFWGFNFILKVLVLRFDVIGRFPWRVGLSIADENRVRVSDVIEKVVNRIVQRFRGQELSDGEGQKNQRDQRVTTSLHINDSIAANRMRGCRSCGPRPG